jgi:hypothetical protein
MPIRYSLGHENLGFRGTHWPAAPGGEEMARVIAYPKKGSADEREVFFMQGIDIDSSKLPYLPDMSAGSEFEKKGAWHYYDAEMCLIVAGKDVLKHLELGYVLLFIVKFVGEEKPRILLDNREELLKDQRVSKAVLKELEDFLREKNISLDDCQLVKGRYE